MKEITLEHKDWNAIILEGYKRLDPEDKLKEGDLFASFLKMKWRPTKYVDQIVGKGIVYIRKVV